MRFERLLTAVFVLLPVSLACSQTPAPAPYDPRVAFAPLTLPDPVNAYRSSNGAPGPSYWQNEADYEMHAALDTQAKTLQNDEVITYTNNSPDSLSSLWIHLDQNIYRKDSRGYLVNGGLRRKKPVPDSEENPNGRTTEGYALDSVEIEHGKELLKADYLVDDTRMQIRLPQPMAPKGGLLKITIRCQACGVAAPRGVPRKRETSTTWPSGIRVCAFTTTFAAGTRFLISAASSTWNMVTLTIT
jgi:hypothetical protein